ncbi:MAG TPA: hypothetical protein VJ891_14485 [Casimicrobiaceae bacterium]|nr:hypothetical protein [Casimicrobiaceae bacterium]
MASTFVARDNNGIDWSIALAAGVIAMVVFGAIEAAFSWGGRGVSAMHPFVVYGTATLHALAPNTAVGGGIRTAIVGGALLLALGALSGVILAYFVDRIGLATAALVGAVFGLAMYVIDMYGIAKLLPVLTDLRDWMSALAYVLEGLLAAALYKVLTREDAVEPVSGPDLRDLRHAPLM